jgi:hypothetical protein
MSVVGGLGWFFICLLLIIPAENPAGQSPYLSRYSYLGHGLRGVLFSPILHPGLVVKTLVSDARLSYLSDLFHPLAYVSLLGFPIVLLAVPALLINMLSSDPQMFSGYYQYSIEIIPFVIVGAISGVAALSSAGKNRGRRGAGWLAPVLCGMVLVAAAVDSYRFGFTPLASGYIVPSAGPHQRLEAQMLRVIPAEAPVAAADEIEPHLDHRKWIYLLPTVHPGNGPAATDVVLDASIPSQPVEPHTLHAVAVELLRRGYGVRRARDGILVLERGARGKAPGSAFYSFIFPTANSFQHVRARWGSLELVGLSVHPRSGAVNRSRPAIEVEAYWRLLRHVPGGAGIAFQLSPVYSGQHPARTAAWFQSRDSPTLDWLPLRTWPLGRIVKTASLDMVPLANQTGKADVAITVYGLGPARSLRGVEPIGASAASVRVASVDVDS